MDGRWCMIHGKTDIFHYIMKNYRNKPTAHWPVFRDKGHRALDSIQGQGTLDTRQLSRDYDLRVSQYCENSFKMKKVKGRDNSFRNYKRKVQCIVPIFRELKFLLKNRPSDVYLFFPKPLYYKGLGHVFRTLKIAPKKGRQGQAYICIPIFWGENCRRKPAYYIIGFLLTKLLGTLENTPFLYALFRGLEFPPGTRVLYRKSSPCKIKTIVPSPGSLPYLLVMQGFMSPLFPYLLVIHGFMGKGPYFVCRILYAFYQGLPGCVLKDLRNWGSVI